MISTDKKSICKGHEKFADLLSFAIINLLETDRLEELSNGTLFPNCRNKFRKIKLLSIVEELIKEEDKNVLGI